MRRQIARMSTKVQEFRSEDGAVAVEAAVTIAGLGMIVMLLTDFYLLQSNSQKMNDSLRLAAQHVINGGHDLSRMEQIFNQSYGRDTATVTNELVCSCPLDVNADGTYTGDVTSDQLRSSTTRTTISNTDDGWPQCTTQCADSQSPQSFLAITASDLLDQFVLSAGETIDSEFLIRILP